jgi:ABC-type branched-subunit amino acid transport system substrate-binding protein
MHSGRAVSAAAVAALLLLLSAACSPGSGSPGAGGSGGASAPAAALSGGPVKIGFIDIEGDLGIDFSPQRKVAQQVVEDLNHAGGIGSHPIELIPCATKAASGGADCANQMVQQKAVIVLDYGTIDTASMYPILKSAGIPVLGGGTSPLNAADLIPDGNHFFIGGGALVRYAATNPFIADTLKAKSVGLLVGSVSSAQQAAEKYIKAPLERRGVKVTTVQLAASNPDYTSAINAIFNTDVLQVLLDCSAQNEAIKQAVALGYKGKIFGCDDPVDLKAMGSAAAHVYSADPIKPVEDSAYAGDPDVKAFLGLAAKYHWDVSSFNGSAYSMVMAARAAIMAAGGPAATGAQVRDTIAKYSHVPFPLGPPDGLTCTPVLSPLAPTACSVDSVFIQVQADGKSVKAVDGKFVRPPAP